MRKRVINTTWLVVLWLFTGGLSLPLWAADEPVKSASELDYPPFSVVLDDGSAGGFSVELMRAALAAMGRSVEYEVGPWSEIKHALEVGQLEALPLVGRTPEREQIFDFSAPYLTLYGAVFTQEDEQGIRSLANLQGRRVGVLRGDNAEEFVRRNNLTQQVVATRSYDEAFRKLSRDELDAVVAQRLVGLILIEELKLNNIKTSIAPVQEFRQDFSFAVTEGNKELLAQLNEGLTVIIKDGTYDQLYGKWLGVLQREQQRQHVIWMVTVGIAAVLLAYILGMYLLQRVRSRRALAAALASRNDILASVPDSLFEMDEKGCIHQVWARNSEELLVSHEQLLGASVTEVLPAAAAEQVLAALAEADEKGRSFGQQIMLPTSAGDSWFELSTNRGSRSARPHHFLVLSRDITRRKQDEQALRENEQRLGMAGKMAYDLIYEIDVDSNSLHWFSDIDAILGYKAGEISTDISAWQQLVHPEDLPELVEAAELHSTPQKPIYNEYRIKHADGNYRYWVDRKLPLLNNQGLPTKWVGVCSDVTDRVKSEGELKLAASVFTASSEGIIITDDKGAIENINQAFIDITGFSREEVIGENPRLLQSGRHDQDFYRELWDALLASGHWRGDIWNRRKNGSVFPEQLTISAVYGEGGKVEHYVGLFSDISKQKAHERQLQHVANYDSLTKLPNRALLADRLQQAVGQTLRRQQKLAVVYLDLDGFKTINDDYGHDVGDQVLIALAARLKMCLRDGDTIARIGGDEFVAVLIDLDDTWAAVPILNRMLLAASEPVIRGDATLHLSASLGVAFYPQQDDIEPDHLLRQADQAMYQAKLSGKNKYQLFDAEQDRSARGLYKLRSRLQRAIEAQEFVLYYQPKVNMRTGDIVGAEALARWQHPEQGILSPISFLPLMEDLPASLEFGDWVVDDALGQIETWRAEGLDISVSVNVGSYQLQQPDFVENLKLLMAAHPTVEPRQLELEILETSALQDLEQVAEVMRACGELGVNFALDDFGTGYSSLAYLKRLPATLLKIDQEFVRGVLDGPEDLAILEGIIGLARAFRRRVIAEGVETVAHGELLLRLGCEYAQGYAIAKPMPADKFSAWLKTWKPSRRWQNLQRINSDNLPVLYAAIEHRAWAAVLLDYLQNASGKVPPSGIESCGLGEWLKSDSMEKFSAKPPFKRIVKLHQDVHGLGDKLVAQGPGSQQQAEIDDRQEFIKLSGQLFQQLEQLFD